MTNLIYLIRKKAKDFHCCAMDVGSILKRQRHNLYSFSAQISTLTIVYNQTEPRSYTRPHKISKIKQNNKIIKKSIPYSRKRLVKFKRLKIPNKKRFELIYKYIL